MNLLAAFAQFETEIRRPITPDEVKGLRDFGLGPSAMARKLNISRASVYRLLEANPG